MNKLKGNYDILRIILGRFAVLSEHFCKNLNFEIEIFDGPSLQPVRRDKEPRLDNPQRKYIINKLR